ncbi:MAG: choice-of-anchor D domain-containing protein [Myxococcota bacterium]
MTRKSLGLLATLMLVGCPDCEQVVGQVTPQGVLDPSVLSFGVVKVGAICTKEVKLKNEGQSDMTVNGAEVRDDGTGGNITVTLTPSSVETGAEAPIVVQYAPTSATNGLKSATLQVNTNDPDNSGRVVGQVTAEAVEQTAGKINPVCRARRDDTADTVPCTSVDFGSTPKSDPGQGVGVSQTITVRNDGTASFDIIAINLLPAEGQTTQPEFTLELVDGQVPDANTFPKTVQPSRSGDCGDPVDGEVPGVPISISFIPTRVGVQAARLQIITTAISTSGTPAGQAPNGEAHISLTGLASGVGLYVDPEFISFGSVAAGSSETRNIRVANLDINPASVNTSCIDMNEDGECATDGPDVECTSGEPDAATGLNCDVVGQGKGFQLSASDAKPNEGTDEVVVTVTWSPPAAVSFSRDLLLMSNIAGNKVYKVRLTGGTAGRIQVSPSTFYIQATPDTNVGTGQGDFTVTNTGEAPLVISRIEFSGSQTITDDFTLTRTGDASFNMSCERQGANQTSCVVEAWTTPFTLEPNASTVFTVAYEDNDEVVAQDGLTIYLTHNGAGGSPYAVDVQICRAADGTSVRPVCP